MTTLGANSPRVNVPHATDFDHYPVIAADIVYEGAAVGDNGSGYARPLTAGDRFLGIAELKVDNASGSAGDLNVRVKQKGQVKLSVSGAVITDVGQPVYASDDDTFVFSPVGNSYIGKIARWISAGVVMVALDVGGADPYGDGPKETLSANKTLDAQDTGKTFFIDTDATTTTLPATAVALEGVKIVNLGADGTVAVNVSPAAADKVQGPDLAGTDNKDLINTKATAKRGDYVVLSNGHADGAVVSELVGIWATEA